MAAVFVVDVPHCQRRVLVIAGCQLLDKCCRCRAVALIRGAVVLTRAGPKRHAFARHRQALGMSVCKPRRRRGGRGGEVGKDAVLSQQVEYAVEPVEFVLSRCRLESAPGEDADRDDVDGRLPHQADVRAPDLLRPLLRVVVTSVEDVGNLRRQASDGASLSDMFVTVKLNRRLIERVLDSG